VSNNLKKNVAKNGIWGAVILESNSDTHTNVDGSLTQKLKILLFGDSIELSFQ
jgi:hypothetical protein